MVKGWTILLDDDIVDVARSYKKLRSVRKVADEFNISKSTVHSYLHSYKLSELTPDLSDYCQRLLHSQRRRGKG